MPRPFRAAAVACALALAACSGPPAPDPAAQRAAAEARAASDLAAYEQLRAAGSHELAVTMGREVLRKFPGTAAAATVQGTLPAVEAAAKAGAEAKRLAALWSYQDGEEQGARQISASLYSSTPASDAQRLRLILRRHAAWGESIYVFGHPPGYRCGTPCTLTLRFDAGAPETWRARVPSTGEPAVFIEEHAKLLARFPGTTRLTVTLQPTSGAPVDAVFEIGGYDGTRYPALPGG